MKQLREKAKLSPEEAAYRIGVAYSTLRNWETGKNEPRLTVSGLSLLLQVYSCSFEELEAAVLETMKKNKD